MTQRLTERAHARHRASHRASTPLTDIGTTLTTAVSDHVGALGRGGVVLAMSSGLVATMGLPANAVTRDAGATTASLPVVPAAGGHTATLVATDAQLLAGTPVVAADGVHLQFEDSSFTAVAKPKPKPKPKPRAETREEKAAPQSRRAARSSRSATREHVPAQRTKNTDGGFGSARGSSVLAIAARYYGIPYRYGGTTPRGFDCSGFTKYVFGQVGVSLPRTAEQQRQHARRISRSEARPGDLVFTITGGRASHVGIYAGGGMMVDSPRTGKSVSKRKIWSSNIVFGRV